MLAAEIPTTAVLVSPGVWIEPLARIRYVLDPSDATLILTRSWTTAEINAYVQSQAFQGTNQTTLTASLTASIATLIADVGRAGNDPLLVKDATSLNGILGVTPAAINANIPGYIQALARYIKHTDKALIASGKISTGALIDATTGQ